MPPTIVPLPTRSGSLRFPEKEVTTTIELLGQCESGQTVRLTEQPDSTVNTARRRVEVMKDQVQSRDGAVPDGFKLRGHVLTDGTPVERKTGGKMYRDYPQNWSALSLVPAGSTPDANDDAAPDVNDEGPGGSALSLVPAGPTPDANDDAAPDVNDEGPGGNAEATETPSRRRR